MLMRAMTRREALKGLLTLAAGATGLVACGATATPQAVTEEQATPQAAEPTVVGTPAQTQEPIVIRFHARMGEQGDHFDLFADKFNTEFGPDVTVKNEHFPGADYYTKINTMIAGGTIGDGFWIYLGGGFTRYAATGVYATLDPIVEAQSYDLGQFFPEAVKSSRYQDKLCGLPWCMHFGCGNLLYYNKPMLDEAGVAYPDEKWTFDDLVAAATKMTNQDTGTFGFLSSTSTCAGMTHFPRAWGGDITNPEGAKCILGSTEAVEGLQMLSDGFHAQKISPLPSQISESSDQMFVAKKLAMYTSGFWGKTIGDLVPADSWGVAPSPKGPAGRGHVFYIDINGVTSFSKHPNEAFKYLTYVSSYEAGMDIYQVRKSIPGARPDVWESDAAKADPHFQAAAWTVKEGMPPEQWGPANFRDSEYLAALSEGLDPVWLGDTELKVGIVDVVERAQSILDKPALPSIQEGGA
jgi:multiple sugar transport system substrate-binding protein